MYAGIGYDVHRFAKKRKLVVGGVTITSKVGLLGHSDADVLVHALMDALLGAAGLEDIGHLFPPSDPKWKGADSMELLAQVVTHITRKKMKINNVDMTLIAETPKIAPYLVEMKKGIARRLKISRSRVGIKATTNESMGFVGRKEGMAAFAVASLSGKRR